MATKKSELVMLALPQDYPIVIEFHLTRTLPDFVKFQNDTPILIVGHRSWDSVISVGRQPPTALMGNHH
jgi:hypothetical protein